MHLPTMLHSVSYSGSWGQAFLTLDEFVDKAADLGFDGVMLMAKRPHLSLLDYGPRSEQECEHLEKRRLSYLVRRGYNNFTATGSMATSPPRTPGSLYDRTRSSHRRLGRKPVAHFHRL